MLDHRLQLSGIDILEKVLHLRGVGLRRVHGESLVAEAQNTREVAQPGGLELDQSAAPGFMIFFTGPETSGFLIPLPSAGLRAKLLPATCGKDAWERN
jgi:hypothetical protein